MAGQAVNSRVELRPFRPIHGVRLGAQQVLPVGTPAVERGCAPVRPGTTSLAESKSDPSIGLELGSKEGENV
jgi:hypothetical protein